MGGAVGWIGAPTTVDPRLGYLAGTPLEPQWLHGDVPHNLG